MAQPLYRDLVLRDGARNYWRLGEASGTTAVDVVGGVNGTISGGVTLGQAGALGDGDKAMYFDAASDYVSVPNGPYSAIGTGPMTIECWVNSAFALGGDNPFIIDTTGGAAGPGFALVRTGASVAAFKIANGTLEFPAQGAISMPFDGLWHHLVGVLRRGTPDVVEVYWDGQLAISANPPANGWNLTSARPLVFGTYAGGEASATFRYNGKLDEVALYPLALSAAQIAAHYNARTQPYVPGTYPARVIASGPSNYWRLGEASGATAVDQVGGANGTISGGVTLGQKGALSEPDTAMGFDGTTGKISIATALAIPSVAYTVEAWIKFTGTAQLPVFSNRDAGGNLYIGVLNGRLFFYNGGGGGGVILCNDNQWHHAVYVNNATGVTHYLDGILDHFDPGTIPFVETKAVTLGEDQGVFWPGSLDDIAFYPRALPLAEIAAHYQAKFADMWDPRLYPPTSPPTTGPVAYPAVTSPYPQPPGTPEYAPRPAPTLGSIFPASVSGALGFVTVYLNGSNYTNAMRVNLAGVLDHWRVDETITYVNPTAVQITLDVRGLVPAAYQIAAVGQDGQSSAALPLTITP